MGEISNIQFVEDVVFEYQIAYKDASDTDKTELKNSFMRFIKTILHKIEKLGDENKNIDKSSNISIIFDSARILLKLLSEYNAGRADETVGICSVGYYIDCRSMVCLIFGRKGQMEMAAGGCGASACHIIRRQCGKR